MGILYQTQGRWYGRNIQNKTGDKRLYTNIRGRLPRDFFTSCKTEHCKGIVISHSQPWLAITWIWCKKCLSTRRSWRRSVHGTSSGIHDIYWNKGCVQTTTSTIWIETITSSVVWDFSLAMRKYGFKQSNSDHTLFIKHKVGKVIVLIVYVDDMIIIGNDEE